MTTFSQHIINGSLCYIFHENRVLLLKRNRAPYIGLWSAPGGKMEHGESPQDAVIREIEEETGLCIEQPVLKGLQSSIDIHYPVHWMLYIFVATTFSGDLIDSVEGILQWHPIVSLQQLDRPYADTLFMEHFLNKKSSLWQSKFVYDTPDKLLEERIYT